MQLLFLGTTVIHTGQNIRWRCAHKGNNLSVVTYTSISIQFCDMCVHFQLTGNYIVSDQQNKKHRPTETITIEAYVRYDSLTKSYIHSAPPSLPPALRLWHRRKERTCLLHSATITHALTDTQTQASRPGPAQLSQSTRCGVGGGYRFDQVSARNAHWRSAFQLVCKCVHGRQQVPGLSWDDFCWLYWWLQYRIIAYYINPSYGLCYS